jgi:hypothetical protein
VPGRRKSAGHGAREQMRSARPPRQGPGLAGPPPPQACLSQPCPYRGTVAAGCRAGGQGRSAPGGSAPRRAEAPAAEGIGIELGLYGPVGRASRAKQAAVQERGSIGVALATREAGDPPARARRAALRRRRAWLTTPWIDRSRALLKFGC